MTSPSREDYLEMLYLLVREKGYARVTDLAAALGLQPSSVTRMVRKLGAEDLVRHEPYQGLGLTPQGAALGRALAERHLLLAEFLRLLGLDEETVQHDVEGIEHHVSRPTLERIAALVAFLRGRPDLVAAFRDASGGGAGTHDETPRRGPGRRGWAASLELEPGDELREPF